MYKNFNIQNCTLYYFNGRGRAEAIRLFLAAADVEYKDERVSDWPEMKPNMIYGQLPVLDANGVQIGQSGSIMRFIADCTNMGGKSPQEKATLDAVYQTLVDSRELMVAAFREKDETLKPEKLKAAMEKVKVYFGHLEKQLEGKTFFGGDSLTYPDFQLYEVTEMAGMLGETDILADFPKLKAVFDGVAKQPNVAKYLKDRPETKF